VTKSGRRGRSADRAVVQESTQTARWQQRRRQIVRTAEVVFAEFGFGAATLEEVAARLELRRSSLAYYFECEEALVDRFSTRFWSS
jgi:AcrR family transcriptional regulator